ncbi:MAG: D-aminoacyl-tRNA deacylase [Bacteroidales bacterium]|jgi:D-tyrosyl-tRNA(Tyr) deacylase
MRVVIQRVSKASVVVDSKIVGQISKGFMILVGFEDDDTSEDIKWLSSKIVKLRVFPDENDVMNKSILEVGGNILLVSQFTLHASTKKGNRPSYIRAAKNDIAEPLYNEFAEELSKWMNKTIQTGIFGADMQVELINDGPVTIIIDTKLKE